MAVKRFKEKAQIGCNVYFGENLNHSTYLNVTWLKSLEKYTLIVTEKPDAAKRIASALDVEGKAKRMSNKGVPYYLARRDKDLVIVPALGHLYTVTSENKEKGTYPIFNYKWVPRYLAEREAGRIRVWLEAITELAKDADSFIDACDYDIEGSIIGYSILKYACEGKEAIAKRMKYSTLTKEELEKSYAEQLAHLDFALIEAGLARHELDWLYGINLSRALMTAAKKGGGLYATLSTGRVQGPTLRFLAARERSIKCFVPTPYWSINARVRIGDDIFEAEYQKRVIQTKKEADNIVNACNVESGEIEKVDAKEFVQPPPLPFDLGSLQNEAYSLFGYTPMRTSSIAQRLYLDALISYPRTSSQKLPPSIGYESILKGLAKTREYEKFAGELLCKPRLCPNEGKKDDPAHPAIYPTGKLPERTLDGAERNIWNLVVKRFMATFGEVALKQSVKVIIDINGNKFYLRGIQTLEEGWIHFYKPFARSSDVPLPQMQKKQQVIVEKIVLEDKFTKPPARYNPSSLLKRMEEEEIGTKATRAGIIQTLYDRKYIHEEKIVVSDLGFDVVDVLRTYCPNIISLDLTRRLEERMNKIQQKQETRIQVIKDTIETLKPVFEELKIKEKLIGEQLSQSIRKTRQEENIIGICPVCKTGNLTIIHSKKTGKRFVGCTNYFNGNCRAAFPLPQKGLIKPIGRTCKACSWPTVLVLIKGKRPWNLCLNPDCPTKEKKEEKEFL